jgi:NAD(P) transhydrogenase subunit alpha
VNAVELLVGNIVVFTLAMFLGVELIKKVPSLLHTPLTSGANAISGITILGSMVVSGMAAEAGATTLSRVLGLVAVALATVNIVGGYLVTDRMLQMFKKDEGARE